MVKQKDFDIYKENIYEQICFVGLNKAVWLYASPKCVR